MIHDPGRGRQNDISELPAGQKLDDPFLKIGDADIVTGGDDAGFVDAVESSRVRVSARLFVFFFPFQGGKGGRHKRGMERD